MDETMSPMEKKHADLLEKIGARNTSLRERLLVDSERDFRRFFETKGFVVKRVAESIEANLGEDGVVLSLAHEHNRICKGLLSLEFRAYFLESDRLYYIQADWNPLYLSHPDISAPVEISEISPTMYRKAAMEREIEDMQRDLQRPEKLEAIRYGIIVKPDRRVMESARREKYSSLYELLETLWKTIPKS